MATTTDLGNVNIFSSLASFNSNKANLKSNDLNFIKQTAAEMATVGGGIVDELLEENGYVKFANGLILQWGSSDKIYQDTTVTFPIAFGVLYSVVAVPKSSWFLSGSNSNFGVKSQNNKSFVANMYDNDNGYAGFNWCAFGKV